MVLLIAYGVTSFTVIKTRLPFVVSPSAQDIAAGPTIKVNKAIEKAIYFMCLPVAILELNLGARIELLDYL
jgi:hypothetical protein